MNRNLVKFIAFLLVLILAPGLAMAKEKKGKDAYIFTIDKQVPHTSVKNQARTGTCWIFATISFLESELLRLEKGEFDLSEMFVARHAYPLKAINYVRLHGSANFGQGGQGHDVLDQIRSFGIVPEEVYPGQQIEETRHNHGEMTAVLQAMLEAVVTNHGGRVTPRWLEAVESVLDVYLGDAAESFSFQGKTYTPQSFATDLLGLNPDDYIELTSYTHQPFYQKYRLEIPDNWTYNSEYFNVPIDDLERIVELAINQGYSVTWDADVSDKGFSPKDKEKLETFDRPEYAIVPLKDWEDQTVAESKEKISKPVQEKEITQEMRQKSFNNFITTDDHLMHLVGLAHDQLGNRFYLIKNSWGTDRRYKGYNYISRAYFRLHTINILVHKNILPPDLKTKLGM